MEQQYPQLAQQQVLQTNITTANNLVTIPVTNIEEANAFRVDLNGTPTFFYNAGKNEIYLKRTNTQTGLADFIVFSKTEQPKDELKQNLEISAYNKEFKVLNDKIDSFVNKIDELYSLLATANATIEETTAVNTKGGKNVK